MTTWRMRIACCVPKASNTHSEVIIFIAYPRQQWLHGRALMLHYTQLYCLPWYFFFVASCVS
jgi:hypothetical protein